MANKENQDMPILAVPKATNNGRVAGACALFRTDSLIALKAAVRPAKVRAGRGTSI
jgi:hypothetical protein